MLNSLIPVLSASPFIAFWIYGLHLIADKKINPTPMDALVITGAGLIAVFILFITRCIERGRIAIV